MRHILAIFLLPSLALASWINTNDNRIVNALPNPLNGTYNPTWQMHRDAGWRVYVPCPEIAGSNIASTAYSDDGKTVTASCGYVVAPPAPGPYAQYDASIASVWPVLPDHPVATNIPAAGLSYRLGEGTNTTWWIVRQGDLVATQVSAHDSQGRAIIRTRRLRTGAESVIPIEEISIDPAVMSTVRGDLLAIKSSLSTNEADAKAIASLTNGFTSAETRAAVNSLRRELIDLIQDVQALRRATAKTAKEIKP